MDPFSPYSLTVTWEQLHAATPIEFSTGATRTLEVRFYDVKGHDVIEQLDLELHCDGWPACDGLCQDAPLDTLDQCGACDHDCEDELLASGVDESCPHGECRPLCHEGTCLVSQVQYLYAEELGHTEPIDCEETCERAGVACVEGACTFDYYENTWGPAAGVLDNTAGGITELATCSDQVDNLHLAAYGSVAQYCCCDL